MEVGKKAADVRDRRPSAFRLPPSAFHLFLYYWLPLIAYLALIVIQSHYPTPEAVPRLPYFDLLLHVAGYGLLGLLLCRAYRSRWPAASSRFLARSAVLTAALFGLSDEIHQYFIPLRTADAWDVLADVIGAALGVGLYFALLAFFGPPPPARSGLTKRVRSDRNLWRRSF